MTDYQFSSRSAASERPDKRKSVPSFGTALALAVGLALAGIAVPLVFLKPEPPKLPQVPIITVVTGRVEVVPQTNPTARVRLVSELKTFVGELYRRAFIPPRQSNKPEASPTPSPVTRIEELFIGRARDSLRAHPEVFSPNDAIRLERGRIKLDGVAISDRAIPQALAMIEFSAKARAGETPVDLHHKGRLLMLRTEAGWRVSGFDLRLQTAPATPSPTPSAPAKPNS